MNTPSKQKKRLAKILLVFFIALALPVYFLLQTVYSQLENEAYYTARQQAETLVGQIDASLGQLLKAEQKRPIAEYQFFNVMSNPLLSESTGIKFSPLSEIPPKTNIKGLIGYFQINTDGSFHLPALPELGQDNLSGLSLAELENRLHLKKRIKSILTLNLVDKNELLTEAKADVGIQKFKEELTLESLSPSNSKRISDKVLNKKTSPKHKNNFSYGESTRKVSKAATKKYKTRKETVQIPDQSMANSYFNSLQKIPLTQQQESLPKKEDEQVAPQVKSSNSIINVLSFESEVSPLQLLLIGQDYLCFYRYVWHDNNRYTQGFITVSSVFFQTVIKPLVKTSAFSSLTLFNTQLIEKLTLNPSKLEFELYKRHLVAPFQKIELRINTAKIVDVSGSLMIDLLALALFFVFFISFIAFYRLGSKQIELARQQQNFISAVSHELKTPLTSIRMYGEMLRSGWVKDETKKQNYYDFIFFESERLSRLITNVLQLARLGHQQHTAQIEVRAADYLLNKITSKISLQIEASDFTLNIIQPSELKKAIHLKVDEDAFYQIMINLVDNAIKFSDKSTIKQIDIGFKVSKNKKRLIFFIRDYGPGIKKNQLRKIFILFYRSEDELTRTTSGTGIGLALVSELAESMHANVAVTNNHPGAEFQLSFPIS